MGDPPHIQNDRGQQISADQGSWNRPPLELSDLAIPGDIQVEGQDNRFQIWRGGKTFQLRGPQTDSLVGERQLQACH